MGFTLGPKVRTHFAEWILKEKASANVKSISRSVGSMCLTAWVMGLKVQTLTTDLKVYTLTISKYTLSQLTSSQIMEYDLQ